MQATPPSTRKSNTPTSAFAQPPFSKDVGQVPYPRLQCEETLPHLSVKRLNSISSHLWLAGRPQADHLRKSTLHHLNATGFQLVILEDADLHLLWKNDMIYIKPLPSCLLNFDFWQENLCSSVEDCDPDQAGRSCDFTLSHLVKDNLAKDMNNRYHQRSPRSPALLHLANPLGKRLESRS